MWAKMYELCTDSKLLNNMLHPYIPINELKMLSNDTYRPTNNRW